MGNGNDRKRDFSSLWERYYPIIITVCLILILLLVIGLKPTVENVDKMIDASINISSILIGFNGALIGILISVQEKEVMKKIFESVKKEEIFKFIRHAIISGFLTLIAASTAYVFIKTITVTSYYVFNVWLLIFIYFLLCSYRVIDILMYLLSIKDIKIERPQSRLLTDEEALDIKQQFGRKNNSQ